MLVEHRDDEGRLRDDLGERPAGPRRSAAVGGGMSRSCTQHQRQQDGDAMRAAKEPANTMGRKKIDGQLGELRPDEGGDHAAGQHVGDRLARAIRRATPSAAAKR